MKLQCAACMAEGKDCNNCDTEAVVIAGGFTLCEKHFVVAKQYGETAQV